MPTIQSTITPQYVLNAMKERSSKDVYGRHADYEGLHMTYEIRDGQIQLLSCYGHMTPNNVTYFTPDQNYGRFYWRLEFEVLAEMEEVNVVFLGTTQFDISL